MLVRTDIATTKLLKAGCHGVAKAAGAIAVQLYAGVLQVIKVFAHLCRRQGGVGYKVHKAGDGALEVDVVFPKRVIGVEEQGLAGWEGRCRQAAHGFHGSRCHRI